jgi:hypothetical protein
VQVKQGENISVTTSENLKVNNVKVRNVQGQQVDLLPLPNNLWSLQSLVPGVYLLDVIVDMSSSGILGVYETVLVILQPDQTPLPPTSVINQLSIYVETEFSFENDTDQNATEPEPGPAPPSPCYFDPTLKECQPIDGKCPPGFSFNENEQCIPIGKCPDGYGRLDDDETGKCYKNSEIQICPDGYITHKNRECPPPYTTPGPTPDPSPEPISCPIDTQGNEVCPPTDGPTPIPGPPPPECPESGPDVCGDETPPPEEPPDSNGDTNGNGNGDAGGDGNGEDGSNDNGNGDNQGGSNDNNGGFSDGGSFFD